MREPVPAFLNMPAELAGQGYTMIRVFANVELRSPVRLVHEPRSDRYYVAEQAGRVWSFPNLPATADQQLVLDLSGHTLGFGDSGLLGIALHPEFAQPDSPNRGFVYVWYNFIEEPIEGDVALDTISHNRLSRFEMPDGALSFDPASELVLIDQKSQRVIHNGGAMFFHPDDGFLYLTVGDDDRNETRQQIDGGLFGGVLRIDVDQDAKRSHPIRRHPLDATSRGYLIPNDNPFVDSSGAVLEEFWALGLRSPHSMSLDPDSGRIWLADVGENTREEIDLLVRGGNYQWAYREATLVRHDPPADLIGTEQPPVYDYGRENGDISVIGGFVYRGAELPELVGRYIFGDFGSNRVWALEPNDSRAATVTELGILPGCNGRCGGITSIVPTAEGEVFFLRFGRQGIWKLVEDDSVPAAIPGLLSQTGAFVDVRELIPAGGVVPYAVNSPFWSDGSVKRRWIALPADDDGELDAESEQIRFATTGEWRFPPGTVLIKHFELPIDERDPSITRRLETRLLVVREDGDVYGVTYKWRDDNSDAELLSERLSETITITEADGGARTQVWTYPSSNDCRTCHTTNAGGVLGVNTRQLNRDFAYRAGVENQLAAWSSARMFDASLDAPQIADLARLAGLTDSTAGLELRVRSYLDANCAHCHRPGGVRAEFDARFDTPLSEQGLVGGTLFSTFGIEGAAVVKPGDLDRSMLYRRVSSAGSDAMPPLGRAVVQQAAVEAIGAWISELSPPAEEGGDVGVPCLVPMVLAGLVGLGLVRFRRHRFANV